MSDWGSEIVKAFGEKAVSKALTQVLSVIKIESHIKCLEDTKIILEALLVDNTDTTSCAQLLARHKLTCTLDKMCDFLAAREARVIKHRQIRGKWRLISKTCLFFSGSNPLVCAITDAWQVKAIREELDCITRDHVKLASIFSRPPTVSLPRLKQSETWSPRIDQVVIGRDWEKETIISELIQTSNYHDALCVASIVGTQGVGKTVLAKYVYGDPQVKSHFELRFWVYVPRVGFDVKEMLKLILGSASGEESAVDEMDKLQNQLQQLITGKKYLLVLDNIPDHSLWNLSWQQLRKSLVFGGAGSKVLITTRSEEVARKMGTADRCMLTGLTEDASWLLFQQVAFTCRNVREPGLKEIGEEIVELCQGVPQVIRVVGGLLREKNTSGEWRYFRDNQLVDLRLQKIDMVQSLKLSYSQLDPRLKLCFALCSLFPKGSHIPKDQLIQLLMAHGYIEETQDGDPSLEDTAEEYLLLLSSRGYFQNVERDDSGFIKSFQINDQIQDFVTANAEPQFKLVDPESHHQLDERTRHVSFTRIRAEEFPSLLPNRKPQLRSLLVSGNRSCSCPKLSLELSKFPSLRALSLSGLGMEQLPNSLDKLRHLKYLNVSFNGFSKLPDSLTNLTQLSTLDLSWCGSLERLPNDIGKLVDLVYLNITGCKSLLELPKGITELLKLRHLGLNGCSKLRHMPLELGKLTHLQMLDLFVVRDQSLSNPQSDAAGRLAELNSLDNLRGELTICVYGCSEDTVTGIEEANMQRKKKIKALHLAFCGSSKEDEMLLFLKALQPPPNLRHLTISGYQGERLPTWMQKDQIHCVLPNLEKFQIKHSPPQGCQEPTAEYSPIVRHSPRHINININIKVAICPRLLVFLCVLSFFVCLFAFIFTGEMGVDTVAVPT